MVMHKSSTRLTQQKGRMSLLSVLDVKDSLLSCVVSELYTEFYEFESQVTVIVSSISVHGQGCNGWDRDMCLPSRL